MSNRIRNPISFTNLEIKIIKKHFLNHSDWDTKNIFNEIKKKIRDKLRPKQKNKCCYCKKELGYDIKEVDIDHILPKSIYSIFTFEPINLALSCPACNTKKGDKEILVKPIKRYPKSANKFLIIHPHLDYYNQHIIIHRSMIYEGISKKGCRTIEYCELFRLKTVEKKAKKKISTKTESNELIDLVINAAPKELNQIMVEIIKRIK